MKLVRGGAGILVFLVGLITFAGALFSLTLTMASAAQTHQPIDEVALVGGLIAAGIGILCLFLSRVIDPDGGPVRSYRERPRKSRSHT